MTERTFGIWVVSKSGSIDAYRDPTNKHGWFYQVHPDDFNTHGDHYSWEEHLSGKQWCTPDVLSDFKKAFIYAKKLTNMLLRDEWNGGTI